MDADMKAARGVSIQDTSGNCECFGLIPLLLKILLIFFTFYIPTCSADITKPEESDIKELADWSRHR